MDDDDTVDSDTSSDEEKIPEVPPTAPAGEQVRYTFATFDGRSYLFPRVWDILKSSGWTTKYLNNDNEGNIQI